MLVPKVRKSVGFPVLDVPSSLPVVIDAIWRVMKSRDTRHYGRVLEFLELVHSQAPGLLCYRHRAKLSSGLKGKLVLSMVEESCSLLTVLKALNCYFPPVFPDEPRALRRDLFRVRQCHFHFRRLVLRMIRDEKFRRHYIEKKLHVEYGEEFMSVLEKLLWEFLYRLRSVLSQQPDDLNSTSKNLPMAEEQSTSDCCTQMNEFSDASTPVIFGTGESPVGKKPKNHVTSTNDKTCTAGEERCQPIIQTRPEDQQNMKEAKQGMKESNICRGSRISDQDMAPSESVETSSSRTGSSDTITEFSDAGQASVFQIFGLDCSAGLEENEKLSPPNPFQSQEIEAILQERLLAQCGQEGRTLVSNNEVCNRQGIQNTLTESNVPANTQMQDSNAINTNKHLSEIKNYKKKKVAIRKVANANADVHLKIRPKKVEGNKSRNAPGLHLGPTMPPSAHLMSWRFQPQVHLTRLPIKLINGCQDQVTSKPTALMPSDDSEPSQGTWRWLCSFPTDNDSSDPDYYPGCE
ncbi:uncharacterized protein O3C94_022208 [Discoglossus pictus]